MRERQKETETGTETGTETETETERKGGERERERPSAIDRSHTVDNEGVQPVRTLVLNLRATFLLHALRKHAFTVSRLGFRV